MCAETEPKARMDLGGERVEIDRCLVSLIRAMNDAGIETNGCCCGHGQAIGWVKFAPDHDDSRDDRYLLLVKGRQKAIGIIQDSYGAADN